MELRSIVTTFTIALVVAAYALAASTDCKACTIGRCEDTTSKSKFPLTSSLLNIFLGLQSSCTGIVESVRFIDNAPKAGKSFYLSIWDIKSRSSLKPIYPAMTAWPADLNQVSVRLVNVAKVTTNGQSGWQTFNFTQAMDIDVGHFIGIHLENWKTLAADSVVNYSTDSGMPTMVALGDQWSIFYEVFQLPYDVPVLSGTFKFSMDKRRPALLVNVKSNIGPWKQVLSNLD